jgi:hypothetical protein
MKCEPYVPAVIRRKDVWDKLAEKLGLHPALVQEVYINHFFRIGKRSFSDGVTCGEITAKDFEGHHLTDEIKAKYDEWVEHLPDQEIGDRVAHGLKSAIQLGDEVVCDETKTYCFSGKQYMTQGKRYKVIGLRDEGGLDFGVVTETDLPGEKNYGGCIWSLWRDGKEVWNWNVAYLASFKELHPGHPQTADMEKHCSENAEKMRKGEKR